jgi:ubiquinol oxidase
MLSVSHLFDRLRLLWVHHTQFLTDHADMLKSKPVPDIARKYYERDNPFLFDLFCTVSTNPKEDQTGRLRPMRLESLYDVFVNVRDDEW